MSVKAAPLKLQPVFNIHYYQNDTVYLTNRGPQRIYGQLSENGEINYGDETVYGSSTFRNEPNILNVTEDSSLLSSNLVTKQYVSNYLNSVMPSINPQTFTYSNSSTAIQPLTISNATGFFNFADTDLDIQTCIVEVNYNIITSLPNSLLLRPNFTIGFNSTYQLTFIKVGSTFFCNYNLLNGDDIVASKSYSNSFNQSWNPIQWGITSLSGQSRPSFIIGYPSNTSQWVNDPSIHSYWISSYSCELRILSSTNMSSGESKVVSTGGASGNVYFSTS